MSTNEAVVVHETWCPAYTSSHFGCYCQKSSLSDPRPEIVRDAVEKKREKV